MCLLAGVDDVVAVNSTFLNVTDKEMKQQLCIFFESGNNINGTLAVAHSIDHPDILLAYFLDTANCTETPPVGNYSVGVFTRIQGSGLKEPTTPYSIAIVPISELLFF